MRIKLVIVSEDTVYTSRLVKRIEERYRGKLNLFAYADFERGKKKAFEMRADIFLIEEELLPEGAGLPRRCAMAYLVPDPDIRTIDETRAICKYQSVQQLYREIVEVFSAALDADNIRRKNEGAHLKNIVTFFSAAGGSGGSTIAAAYAIAQSAAGKKVLYLNLEDFGTSDIFFSGEGDGDLGKVIYAIEMGSGSSLLRLENAMKRDARGVYFYSAAPSALDMQDLTPDLLEQMFEYLRKSALLDTIVVDMHFDLTSRTLQQMERSDSIVMVSDGSLSCNEKLRRMSNAIEVLSAQNEKLLGGAALLMYNRFSSLNGKKLENTIFTEIGGVGRIENATPWELAGMISTNEAVRSI